MSTTNPIRNSSVGQEIVEQLDELTERVEQLEQENEQLREAKQQAEQERDELAERVEDLEDEQETTDDKADANRAALVGIINDVRGYEGDERLGMKTSNGVLHKEGKNTGSDLYDTMQVTQDLDGLAQFREELEDNAASRSKVDSQLAVLEHAREYGEVNDVKIVRLDYKQLANVYGCNERYAYDVMEQMAEEVPGCLHKTSRDLAHDTLGVGGQHLEVQLANPKLRGWLRARE